MGRVRRQDLVRESELADDLNRMLHVAICDSADTTCAVELDIEEK